MPRGVSWISPNRSQSLASASRDAGYLAGLKQFYWHIFISTVLWADASIAYQSWSPQRKESDHGDIPSRRRFKIMGKSKFHSKNRAQHSGCTILWQNFDKPTRVQLLFWFVSVVLLLYFLVNGQGWPNEGHRRHGKLTLLLFTFNQPQTCLDTKGFNWAPFVALAKKAPAKYSFPDQNRLHRPQCENLGYWVFFVLDKIFHKNAIYNFLWHVTRDMWHRKRDM